MRNTISNGDSWKSLQADDSMREHGKQSKKPTQSSAQGYSGQSHFYIDNHGGNTQFGKSNHVNSGAPDTDAAQYNHHIHELAALYSGTDHPHGPQNNTGPSNGNVQSGSSVSNGSNGGTDINGSTGSDGSTGSTNSTDSTGSTNSTDTSVSSTSAGSNGSDMGVQLNFAGGDTIASYEQRTGVKPVSVGGYISANSGTLDMSSAQNYIQQAGQNGVPTVQLSINCGEKGAMSQQELSQFTQLAQQAKSQGVNLQVRFGYEMNNTSVSGYTDPNTFKQQWDQVAGAVHSGGGQMVWSPANSTQSDYQKWMPDPSTIDVVGLDVYHMGSGPIQPNEVKDAISGIESVPGLSGKPLTLPETGVQLAGDGSDSSKVSQWLSQLSDPSLKTQYPNYQGFMWFDYNKPGDGNYALSQNSQYEQALTQWYDS